jgi:transcriptional regulator with XRE-family HTH domain
MTEKNLSQVELASRLNTHPASLSNILSGKRHASRALAAKIAKVTRARVPAAAWAHRRKKWTKLLAPAKRGA